jgi:hypothetical protein
MCKYSQEAAMALYTQEVLAETLKDLMAEKPLDDITVMDKAYGWSMAFQSDDL